MKHSLWPWLDKVHVFCFVETVAHVDALVKYFAVAGHLFIKEHSWAVFIRTANTREEVDSPKPLIVGFGQVWRLAGLHIVKLNKSFFAGVDWQLVVDRSEMSDVPVVHSKDFFWLQRCFMHIDFFFRRGAEAL